MAFRKARLFLAAGLLLLGAGRTAADIAAYQGTAALVDSTEAVRVVHRHDWSKSIGVPGVLRVTDRKSGKSFAVESPPLNVVWISPDDRFVVGLSKIKLSNPAQAFILDIRTRKAWKVKVECSRLEGDSVVHRKDFACSESVTNWIFWYDEKDPGIDLEAIGGTPLHLTFRDAAGKPSRLKVPGDFNPVIQCD